MSLSDGAGGNRETRTGHQCSAAYLCGSSQQPHRLWQRVNVNGEIDPCGALLSRILCCQILHNCFQTCPELRRSSALSPQGLCTWTQMSEREPPDFLWTLSTLAPEYRVSRKSVGADVRMQQDIPSWDTSKHQCQWAITKNPLPAAPPLTWILHRIFSCCGSNMHCACVEGTL